MKWKPYPSYKPSGVEWLGDVPAHWDTKPLGYLARFRGGATPDKSRPDFWDGYIPWVSPKDMKRPRLADAEDHVSERALSGSALSMIPPRAVLIVVRGMILAHSFPVATTDGPLTINQDMKALLPGPEVDAEYLARVLTGVADVFVALADESAHGTRKIESAVLSRFVLPLPPPDDQSAVSQFLDRETARLDALVAKKRALVERLREKRTALISRTVTRGLPPEAARAAGLAPHPNLKPSGIPWLGNVPEHWSAVPLRRAALVLDCKHRTVEFVDDGVPVASIREVHGFEVDLSAAKMTTEEEHRDLCEGGRRPLVGDIIYSRNATVGDAALVATTERFSMGQDVCLLRPLGHLSRFLVHALRSQPVREQVESLMIGSTFRRINVSQINAFLVPLPPVPEQQAIAEYLDRETARIDRLVEKVEAATLRLQEYRQALITAAVTGKIDVRDKAPGPAAA
ncbi:MAG: restriction endonuclease subunit S [Vicinamibacteria bacterium]|nr:restriction endonuclease subunit S [Vicinamibacteria bacterium]